MRRSERQFTASARYFLAATAALTQACGGALVEPTAEMRLGERQKFVATADVTLHERELGPRREPDCLSRGSTEQRGGFTCLLRFTLPETRVAIQSAWLELHVLNSSPFTYDLYSVLPNWSETDATWKERAPGLPWQAPGAKGSGDRGQKIGELTVPGRGDATLIFDARGRAVLESWLADPSTHRGIVIASDTNYDGIAVASREHPTVDHRPTLVIQAGGAAGPGPDARSSE
jgi:hypothetical protein